MPRQVALLRAINVGGRTVRMAELCTRFAELGFTNVETFIASGNVIFDARDTNTQRLERQIARHLGATLGYQVEAFIRSVAELKAIAAYRAFPAAERRDPSASVYVLFLQTTLNSMRRRAVEALGTPHDVLRVHGREIYWLARRKLSGTLVDGPALAKALGTSSSMRNMNTVQRLDERYGAERDPRRSAR